MLGKALLTEPKDQELRASVEKELDEAFDFARKSPYPEPEAALQNLFV
jgi:TPP-dependent pyruvate/acetoin dehydrogenase alpha subunit